MSTLAQGLTDYRLPDYRDHAAVLSRLATTVSDLAPVHEYWRSVDPESKEHRPAWTVDHRLHPADDYLAYHGPGGFSVRFGPRVAIIAAGCRYSGFATIRPLQNVHLAAFKSVARALGGTRLVLMPEENGPIYDAAMYGDVSLDECVTLILTTWGAPHPAAEILTEDLEAYYRRKFPVWYVETLERVA
jgi:hypothetical protein